MNSLTVKINDIAMFGVVGEGNLEASICYSELWINYCNWFKRCVCNGRPVSMLNDSAKWELNGKSIIPYKAWFMHITN